MHMAAYYGGSLSIFHYNTDLFITRCQFIGGYAYFAAAMRIRQGNDRMKVSHSTFIDNYSDSDGAAIYLILENNNFLVDNCLFDGNIAGGVGSSIIIPSYSQNTSVQHCEFIGNVGYGVLYAAENSSHIALSNVTFSDNSGGPDTVFLSQAMSVSIANSTFSRSTEGSIILKQNSIGFTVSGCQFLDNRGAMQGGAVYIDENNTHILFQDCVFRGNFAEDSGGAVYLKSDNHNVTFLRVIFEENSAGV